MSFSIDNISYYDVSDVQDINIPRIYNSLKNYKEIEKNKFITLIKIPDYLIKKEFIPRLKYKIKKSINTIDYDNIFLIYCDKDSDFILKLSNYKENKYFDSYIIIYTDDKLEITETHIDNFNTHITKEKLFNLSNTTSIYYDNKPIRYFENKSTIKDRLGVVNNSSTSRVDKFRSRSRSPIRRSHRDRSRSPLYRRYRRSRSPSPQNDRHKLVDYTNKNILLGGYSNTFPTSISSSNSLPPPLIYNDSGIKQEIELYILKKELEQMKEALANQQRAINLESSMKNGKY